MICRPVLVWDELVLAKVIEVAKEIRPDDKKRGAAPAVGRAALWSAGGWSRRRLLLLSEAGRLLAFLGAGDAMRKDRRLGDGLPVVAFWVACLPSAGGLPLVAWAVR